MLPNQNGNFNSKACDDNGRTATGLHVKSAVPFPKGANIHNDGVVDDTRLQRPSIYPSRLSWREYLPTAIVSLLIFYLCRFPSSSFCSFSLLAGWKWFVHNALSVDLVHLALFFFFFLQVYLCPGWRLHAKHGRIMLNEVSVTCDLFQMFWSNWERAGVEPKFLWTTKLCHKNYA